MRLPNLREEKRLWKSGLLHIAGVDEVGRGAWAGPIVAAAVIFPPKVRLPKLLNDSKKLNPKVRQALSEEIRSLAIDYNLALLENTWINEHGLGKANDEVLRLAILGLKTVDFALIDYFELKGLLKGRQRGIKNGDEIVASISAASILAKVYRDKIMINYAEKYGEYGWTTNKGYGTKKHQETIRRLGATPIHRIDFISKYLPFLPCPC